MSKRLLTVSLALAVASALIFIPLTAGGQEGRSEGAQPGAAVPSDEGGATVDEGAWDGDGPAPRDQVILDDLIVDGSACIGIDCVNGESFGFDTLRLKENNLRIKAQDTSTSASFPSADWQITFNDSANGGQNKFSIDNITDPGGQTPFTIEAGANSHALYVDDGERIGLSTNNPVVELHIVDGDTPTVRLEQDGSSGFTPQTWDLAGNETNFFIRDATNGSKLPFRIRPSAPGNSIYVDTDGDIGFNDTSPDGALDIEETNAALENNTLFIVQNATVQGNGGTQLVGIGTNSPDTELEIASNHSPQIRYFDIDDNRRWDTGQTGAGDFLINDAGSANNEFLLSAAGDLTIEGGLVTGTAGSCTVATPCDGVFDPDAFQPPSIEEHAAYMWENRHLQAVGPTAPRAPINLTLKTTGILHELELAHIYIDQLNERVKALETQLAALQD